VDLDAGVVVGDRAPGLALFRLVVAGQVGRDLLPALPLVAAAEQNLGGVVERVGIVRRDHDRRVPLEAVLQVLARLADRQLRPGHDLPALTGAIVVARDGAAIAPSEDHLGILRFGRDPPALASSHLMPVAFPDAPPAPTACGRDRRVVLLGAVYPVRKT